MAAKAQRATIPTDVARAAHRPFRPANQIPWARVSLINRRASSQFQAATSPSWAANSEAEDELSGTSSASAETATAGTVQTTAVARARSAGTIPSAYGPGSLATHGRCAGDHRRGGYAPHS